MNRTFFYAFLSLCIVGGIFVSCNSKKDRNGRTDTPTSGTISFVSDESFSPIVEELREQFEFDFPKARLKPIYTNAVDGLQQIQDLKTCLFITSRALRPSEVAYLKTKKQLPEVYPIAYDGLALIVNRQNTDTCITVTDVKRIMKGEITDWKQLNPLSQKGKIEVVFDNKQSATLQYVVDSILDGKPITSPNIVAAKTSKEVIDYVDKTPNSIGVIGSNWLNDRRDSTNTTFRKNIQVMRISVKDKAYPYNSWQPYQAYLLDGRYPFVRTIYAIVVDPQKGLPWSFGRFISGSKGQLIVFKAGLLPMRGDITIKKVNVKRN